MKHSNILVLGGSGFIGRHLIAHLMKLGRRVTVPTRRRENAQHLILFPTVDVIEADIHDPAALARLVAGQDAVINLVGILHGDRGTPWGKDFERAHVALARSVTAACQAGGVKRLLHMSALGAAINGPSMYLRSKAAGEAEATSDQSIATTVFRPSVVFGEEDRFLNLFASLQRWFPVMPLASADAHFQPVWVEDLAHVMAIAIDAPATYGKTYELAGPRIYTLADLVRIAGTASGHPRPVLALPAALGRLQAGLMEWMPGPTMMSLDNVDSMRVANIASGKFPGLDAPELWAGATPTPTPLEQIAPLYLSGRHNRTRYQVYRERAGR